MLSMDAVAIDFDGDGLADCQPWLGVLAVLGGKYLPYQHPFVP